MNHNLTEIVFILDRSQSMSGLENDTIGGFNGFVKEQAQLGQTNLTTVLFDDRYEILHDGIDAKDAVLTNKTYFTRGWTALLDAVGKTIKDVGKRLEKTPESLRPGKVIFVITTDGEENSSRKYTYDKVKQMITHQTEQYGWEFIFLGANIDVVKEGSSLGIDADQTFAFEASSRGLTRMYAIAGAACKNMRVTKPQDKKAAGV